MLPIKAKYKIARRLGPVFEKTQSQKFVLREQRRKDNSKGGRRPKQLSEFGKQLLEKQKLRITYGLKEKQLVAYIKRALASSNDTVNELYTGLETRLDSMVYRAGFADTRRMARQLVSHGHFTINGRKSTVASTIVKPGTTVTVREGSKSNKVFTELHVSKKDHKGPAWLKISAKDLNFTYEGKIEVTPGEYDFKKIIEFYTR